ncbi:MAG: hypothetical protein ABWW70_06210 [Thermoproteota archaeon]
MSVQLDVASRLRRLDGEKTFLPDLIVLYDSEVEDPIYSKMLEDAVAICGSGSARGSREASSPPRRKPSSCSRDAYCALCGASCLCCIPVARVSWSPQDPFHRVWGHVNA